MYIILKFSDFHVKVLSPMGGGPSKVQHLMFDDISVDEEFEEPTLRLVCVLWSSYNQ